MEEYNGDGIPAGFGIVTGVQASSSSNGCADLCSISSFSMNFSSHATYKFSRSFIVACITTVVFSSSSKRVIRCSRSWWWFDFDGRNGDEFISVNGYNTI